MQARWYLTLLALLIGASQGTAEPSRQGELSFRLDRQGAVIVPVTIQGHGPFPFILDTGSSHSAISDEIAGRLVLAPVARSNLQTSTGSVTVPVVEVDGLVAGGVRAARLLASVLTKDVLQLVGREIGGVLGQDFLSIQHFTIDYRHRRLTWDDLVGSSAPADEHGLTRLPLAMTDGRFLVQMAQGDRAGTLRLVADTGSSELVLFDSPALDRLDLSLLPERQPMTLTSMAGSSPARLMRLGRLVVGSFTVRNRRTVVVPSSGGSSGIVQGLLPLHTFSRVSFRPRDGYVIILP